MFMIPWSVTLWAVRRIHREKTDNKDIKDTKGLRRSRSWLMEYNEEKCNVIQFDQNYRKMPIFKLWLMGVDVRWDLCCT